MKNPTLYLAYFYNGDEKDATTFIADNTPDSDEYEDFLKFANDYNDWDLVEDDIIDIFAIDSEEDANGKRYKITIN